MHLRQMVARGAVLPTICTYANCGDTITLDLNNSESADHFRTVTTCVV